MDIKRVCRLCCNKDEVKYSLFIPDEGGICLSEQIEMLTNIEISKDQHLSDCICVNCYKVNSFFKEFRKNCLEVKNYFEKHKPSEKSLTVNNADIIIKEEQLDDYEDQSADPLGSQGEDASRNCDVPYPVALVQSLRNSEEMSRLHSNFLATKRSREEAGASLTPEKQNNNGSNPKKRAEKRRHEDAEGIVRRQRPRIDIPTEEELLSHVVKQEEVDICDSPVENEIITNDDSLDEPWSPPASRHSLHSGNVDGYSSPEIDSYSSTSSCSSDDSDDEDDNDMLMLLALLL